MRTLESWVKRFFWLEGHTSQEAHGTPERNLLRCLCGGAPPIAPHLSFFLLPHHPQTEFYEKLTSHRVCSHSEHGQYSST